MGRDMSINRVPYQDDILRCLASMGSAAVSQISEAIAAEGRHTAEGHDSAQLHNMVAENLDHLVHLGLTEYTGSGDRESRLTARGNEAAASLP